ncbi:MAG: hypothetical protein HGB05_02700 [Chloroflexi bacterium]|nr:hypothetical protein [Chloroflexota bacterium]
MKSLGFWNIKVGLLHYLPSDHPEWGARPLRRIIQKFVREPLTDYLLEKNPSAGTKILVDVEERS